MRSRSRPTGKSARARIMTLSVAATLPRSSRASTRVSMTGSPCSGADTVLLHRYRITRLHHTLAGGVPMSQFANYYGHFSDDGLEYVVTHPETPMPWVTVV